MKKTGIIRFVSFVISALMLFSFPMATIAAGEMAYNIYSDPDTSRTSKTFDTFMIDFNGVQAAEKTYWALANFNLYFSNETRKAYRNITGGGAYAGLQDVGNVGDANPSRVAIMAFWEMNYRGKGGETVNLRAKRVFPKGSHDFGGEGEGTNCIKPYDWKEDHWYRMILHSWTDKETGTTFVGQWVVDLETGICTLISYFDTQLYNSCMQGSMSLFQENFYGITKELEREFRVKNIYALDHKDHQWKSLNKSKLSYGNGGNANKVGGHSFGATEEYFWGKSGGTVENQAEYDKNSQKQGIFTINQPENPTLLPFGEMENPMNIKTVKGKTQIEWNIPKLSTPLLSYKLEVVDESGKTLFEKEATRPEEVYVQTDKDLGTDKFLCKLTLTNIFGEEISFEKASKALEEGNKPAVSPDNKPVSPENQPSKEEDSKGDSEKGSNVGVVIGVSAAAIIVVAGIVVAVVLVKKKKTK